MKSKAKTPSEYDAFSGLLRRVLQVPHSELKAQLDSEKRAKKEKRAKTSPASRVSSDKN